jgi:hypothetical protein
MKEQENFYVMRIICMNCKNKEIINIPKGVLAEDIVKEKICGNCGIKKLRVMQNQTGELDFFDDLI